MTLGAQAAAVHCLGEKHPLRVISTTTCELPADCCFFGICIQSSVDRSPFRRPYTLCHAVRMPGKLLCHPAGTSYNLQSFRHLPLGSIRSRVHCHASKRDGRRIPQVHTFRCCAAPENISPKETSWGSNCCWGCSCRLPFLCLSHKLKSER